MRFMNEERVKQLNKKYPYGTRVKLCHMEDPYAPPMGTEGTVYGIDAAGSVLVKWDNGSMLNVIYGVDSCEKIKGDSK